MILEVRAVPPFDKNGFVLGCERTHEAVLIDPGDEVDELIGVVRDYDLDVRHILLTHAHLDHITGVASAKEAYEAPVYLHRDDLFLYDNVVQQGAMFGFRVRPQPPVDVFYDGSSIRFGDYEVRVHHTPGHCPGGVCLQIGKPADGGHDLFVGVFLRRVVAPPQHELAPFVAQSSERELCNPTVEIESIVSGHATLSDNPARTDSSCARA
jgi:glyoxylase-like metal-dependent hydrolase (beta-lactamase superfamily II)